MSEKSRRWAPDFGRTRGRIAVWTCAVGFLLQVGFISASHAAPDQTDDPAELRRKAADLLTQERFRDAAAAYEKALSRTVALRGADSPEAAIVLTELGSVYTVLADFRKAEQLLTSALKIREAKFGVEDVLTAETLLRLGTLHRTADRPSAAEPLLQRALKIREAKLGPEHLDTAEAVHQTAMLQRWRFRYAEAQTSFARSLGILSKHLGRDHPLVARTINDLGRVYIKTGDSKNAWQACMGALAVQEKALGRGHTELIFTLVNLGEIRLFFHGKPDAALELYQRAMDIAETKLGPTHPSVAFVLNNTAIAYGSLGKWSEAEGAYRRSLTLSESAFGRESLSAQRLWGNLAGLYLHMGRLSDAEVHARRAMDLASGRGVPDHPESTRLRLMLAQTFACAKRWDEAVEQFTLHRRSVRRHVAGAMSVMTEREHANYWKWFYEGPLAEALSVAACRRADPRIAEISAEWLLNGKGVAHEAAAERERLLHAGADPTVRELGRRLLALRAELSALSERSQSSEKVDADRERFGTLAYEQEELAKQLALLGTPAVPRDPWVPLADVRRALDKDSVLIEFVRVGLTDYTAENAHAIKTRTVRYLAWIVPPAGEGRVEIVDLGAVEPINEAVGKITEAVRNSSRLIREDGEAAAERAFRREAAPFVRAVLEPLLIHIRGRKNWIIGPDMDLWMVPWAALPLPDGAYAVEKHGISLVSTGRDLVAPAPVVRTTAPQIFADPDYNLGAASGVSRLPGTAAEAAGITPSLKAYAGAEPIVRLDKEATETAFKAVQSPKVVVLSTHGHYDDDAPAYTPLLRSGLLLAGGGRRANARPVGEDDGVLTGLEAAGVNLRGTELVVLSACETGLGQVNKNEGIGGLRQAFLWAGARTVAATLWRIPDKETAELMIEFFKDLAAGKTKIEALRSAQARAIASRRAASGAAHPYYWASFTLTGKPW